MRKIGAERRSEYHRAGQAAAAYVIQDGDEVTLTSDKYPGTILVRIEGAHLGERTLVLPYGATAEGRDGAAQAGAAGQLSSALQLFRKSVATRQKELMETSLRGLETYALTARSATSEEASLRQREGAADPGSSSSARAKCQPRGQVVLARARVSRARPCSRTAT